MKINIIFRLLILTFCIQYLPLKVLAQLDDNFFNQLKNRKVESSDDITWEQYGPGNAGYVNLLRYHPTNPDLLLTSPDMFNTYQTEDNGKTWYTVKDHDGTGLFMKRLADIYYSAKKPTFGLAIEGSRFFKTEDTGKSWSYITFCPWYQNDNQGYDKKGWYSKVSALAIDPNDENVWYVGAGAMPRGQAHLGWNAFSNTTSKNPRGRENIHYNVPFQGKIWRTDNGGQSWVEINTGLNNKAQFSRIIVHPDNSNIVYASSSHGIYKSENKGASWEDIGAGQLDNNTIMDMDYYYNASTKEFVLYIIDQVRYHPEGKTVSNTGGVFKSEDNGDTWIKINGNLSLDINRLTGGVRWNFYDYLKKWFGFSSTNEAISAYPETPKDAIQYFNSLNVDPSDPNTLYIGFYDAQTQYSFTPGRLWQTRNRGESWVNIARDYGPAWENDKEYWQERGNPFNDNMEEGHHLTSMQFNDNYPWRSLRYCAVNSRGDIMILYAHNTFLSTDKGVTWKQIDEDYTASGNLVGRGNSNHPGSCIFQDKRLGKGVMYLGSGEHKLWKSTTEVMDGKPAVQFLENSEETVFAVTTHPFDPNIVYTTSMRQHNMDKIMRSKDAGKTWETWGNATDGTWYMRTNSLLIDPINPTYMYFGVNILQGADLQNKKGGVFVSYDAGKNFQRQNNGLPNFAKVVDLAFDPRDKTYASLFAAAQYNKEKGKIKGGLYFTSNRGATWTKISTPSMINGVNSVTFDHTGRLYITAGHKDDTFENGGAWYSDDFGQNWTRIFKAEHGFQFDVSPFDHNRLLLVNGDGALNPGIYLSEDRGLTWRKNNQIIGQPDKITDIEFDYHEEDRITMTILGSGFLNGKYEEGKSARKITIPDGSQYLKVNEKKAVNAVIDPSLVSQSVIYKSEDSTIASIDNKGEIQAHKQGLVKIWVTSEDGRYSDFIQITVSEEEVIDVEEDKEDIISSNDISLMDNEVFMVYPNPFSNEIFISNITLEVQLSLYDLIGNEIGNFIIQPKYGAKIPLNLTKGLYFYNYQYKGNLYSGKLLKQ